jgi:superfamily I DNA/RNA helicase
MTSQLIFGPPGTGKTYTLIGLVSDALAKGVRPERIAFVSFTKKAVAEAVNRAGHQFGLTYKDLPYFRTLHSIAFRGLGLQKQDVMAKSDWDFLSNKLNMDFSGVTAINPEDGVMIPSAVSDGALYVQIITKARYSKTSLGKAFKEANNYNLHFFMLEKIDENLRAYKQGMMKVDFTDMIDVYTQEIETPELDLLIVDEAQDLTPLQWDMVAKMAANSAFTYYAGDDDQAVHRWTGVDLKLFLNASPNKRVLTQSYRMPISVHKLSQQIVKRISYRQQKDMPKRGTAASVKHGAKKLLDAVSAEDVLDYQTLSQRFGLIAPLEVDVARALNLSSEEAHYIAMLEARGEDILAPARIKVSTFHAMKGGEDDNCAVFLASTKRFSIDGDKDDLHRAFYVGLTRARKNLFLIESNRTYRYDV